MLMKSPDLIGRVAGNGYIKKTELENHDSLDQFGSSFVLGDRLEELGALSCRSKVPELGDFEVQDRAVGIHLRPPTELAIEVEEQSVRGVQHFCRAGTAFGLTGLLTLTKCDFHRFRDLQNFTFWSLRPRGNPKTQNGGIPRENASENKHENLA